MSVCGCSSVEQRLFVNEIDVVSPIFPEILDKANLDKCS